MVIGQPATVTTAVFSLTLIISPLGIRQSHSVLVSSFSNWWNSLSTVSPIIHDYPRIILFSLSVSFSPRRVQSQGLIIRTLLLSLPVHLLICFSFSLSLCQSLFNPHHCIPFDVVASTHFLSLRYRFFLFLRHSSQFCCCVREKHETQLSVVSDSNKFNSRSSNARHHSRIDNFCDWLITVLRNLFVLLKFLCLSISISRVPTLTMMLIMRSCLLVLVPPGLLYWVCDNNAMLCVQQI